MYLCRMSATRVYLRAYNKQMRMTANEVKWEEKTVPQIKDYLKNQGVRGYSRCKKQELVEIAQKIEFYRNPEEKKSKEIIQPKNSNEEIQIYTDGCCFRNGQPNAKAGVGVYFGPNDKRNISEPLSGSIQTNQRAEITAVIRALQKVSKKDKVNILSDSNYVINGKIR